MPVLATVGGASSRGFGEFRPASAGGSFIVATGGTTADSGNYRYHTFNSSGTFAVSAWPSGKYVDFLVVGGGGAGGGSGGGGGGLLVKETISGSVGSYAVTVGAGGTVALSTDGRAGETSFFLGYGGLGGGGGGGDYGGSGGSGGGGFIAGGAGLQPTTAYGGRGNAGDEDTSGGGGGGGAGAAGVGVTGGAGYSGLPLSSSTFAAGASVSDGAGTANTGNGGGANSAGGSGIVIIRYLFQ